MGSIVVLFQLIVKLQAKITLKFLNLYVTAKGKV